ncbi:MAG: thioredoxin [Gammaproteobacteria bacterium]
MTAQHLINSTAEDFEADVLVNSNERPVLVDFWADWCGPCKSIAPLLEQLAAEYDGRLLVVKVDTDAEQALAQQYGIRSLPTMMVFRDGEIVEQIIGAQPMSAIKAAVEPFLPRAGDELLPEINAVREAGDLTGALAAVTSAIELDPDDHRLAILQADIMLDLGDVESAVSILSQLPIAVAASDEAQRVESRAALANQAKASSGDGDLGKRFKQAADLATHGEFDEALEILLDLIVEHRDWKDGLLRETIVNIFAQMDSNDERLKTYRSRLARTLN